MPEPANGGNAAYPGQYGPVKTRLLALAQLVTSPLVLLLFVVAEPSVIPEWPRYVGHCLLTIIDGRAR